ncbi:MAG: DNA internalization-related competence protein ComEC/Rec2 [Candidatus Neomarinimicrobiota bacterium]
MAATIAAILVFILLLINDKSGLLLGLWLTLIMLLGWYSHSATRSDVTARAAIAHNLDGRTVDWSGIVLNAQNTEYGTRVTIEDCTVREDRSVYRLDGKYMAYTDSISGLSLSDTLSGTGVFSELPGPRNPGEFDFRNFYQRQGVFGRIFQMRDVPPVATKNDRMSAGKLIDGTRTAIMSHFRRHVGGQPAGLLTALILGVRSEVDPEIREAFVTTGVVHVLAVSGLHVGYVLLILMIVARSLRIPWGWDRIAVIAGLFIFVVLTGGKPSVVRAALMSGLYILAPVVNRPANTWNLIACAAFALLLVDPTYIHDLGFMLSFTAVLSIVYFYNLFERILPERWRVSRIENKWLKFIWGLFLVSLSAQIGTLPFTVLFFQRIPIISLVANVIIVPLVGILVALGFALLLLGWIPGAGFAIGNSVWLLAEIIIQLARLFAAVPLASVAVAAPDLGDLLLYLAGLAFIFLLIQPNHRRLAVFPILSILLIVTWSRVLNRSELEVLFLDVGQGDATIIRFDDGRTMLIDAGDRTFARDAGEAVVVPVARYLGIKKFDYVVMTHPHSDHIGGLPTVLETLAVDTVWDTDADYHSHLYTELRQGFGERGVVCRYPQRGDQLRLGPITALQVLAPDSVFSRGERNVNNWSIVLRLVHGETTFLFTGDLEYEGDCLLIPLGKCLDSDVLKIAHHGSITGTTDELIAAVSPQLALISVGRRNKFSHPSPAVLQRLDAAQVRTWRTDNSGALWLGSDGRKIRELAWK